MIVIESTGRKLKDAIDSGLEKLGKTLAEVDVQVIDNGGLFRKAKVRITAQGDEPVVQEAKSAPAPVIEEKQNEKREERHEERREKRERPQRSEERKEHAPKPAKEHKEVVKEEHKEERKEQRKFSPISDEAQKKAVDFVTALITKIGAEAEVNTSVVEGELHIVLSTEGSALIGYHGEVLDSIEYMVSYVINREPDKYYHVMVDCNNYREKRKESLVALAHKMAAKCLKVRHKVVLEPMNSNERKIIHSALADNDQIITRSEGQEPNRRIVILCKKR